MLTPAVPPDDPRYYTDQFDEIAWGQSKSGNVPAGSPADWADRAGLPRPDSSPNGVEHIHTAHEQTQRWKPPREASEYDPVRSGTPPPTFRKTMAPYRIQKGVSPANLGQ